MAKDKDFFNFNKAINWNKLKNPKVLKELEKIFEEKKTNKRASEQAYKRASEQAKDDMKKYRVSLEVDKEWVKNFDLTFDAVDEQDAEAQAMVEVKMNLGDYNSICR